MLPVDHIGERAGIRILSLNLQANGVAFVVVHRAGIGEGRRSGVVDRPSEGSRRGLVAVIESGDGNGEVLRGLAVGYGVGGDGPRNDAGRSVVSQAGR